MKVLDLAQNFLELRARFEAEGDKIVATDQARAELP